MRNPTRSCALPGLDPEIYARWRVSEVGATTERLERRLILELAGDVTGRDIIDIGCGDGGLCVALRERGANVVGIDVSRSMLEAARLRADQCGADVALALAAADRIPFPAESFDMVSAITILCFVEDAGPVFDEMARVLRPGGRLVIGELGKWSTWAAERRIRGWLGSPLWRRGRFRTAGELRGLADRAGLVSGPARGAIYYPRLGVAARHLAPHDAGLGRLTTVGAAFVAISAVKPADPG